MEVIKKNHKKIVSYTLIILGIIALIIIAIIRPIKPFPKEIYNYNLSPKLSEINSSLAQNITIPDSNPAFLELRFEDDSINQYSYTITLAHNSEIIFEHLYNNEQSNIIRIPTSEVNLQKDDVVNLEINCIDSCKNAKINLYDIDGKLYPKILIAYYKQDISLYWYGVFLITVGFTLLPLSKESR